MFSHGQSEGSWQGQVDKLPEGLHPATGLFLVMV